jgi:hypothetical protein
MYAQFSIVDEYKKLKIKHLVALINFATHVTFLTKEMKLLPEKWKPSESNQCGFGRKSAVFQAHH